MIEILDEALVNKIAAGEVIERPVNVVKELVENAVDAGASRIVVTLDEGLIKVEDDGIGMSKDDLQKCVIRHATSKITSFNDLYGVESFGFRGEALSSIAAVSDLTIISKEKGALEGYQFRVEGGAARAFKPIGSSEGTIVQVKDLFFNTPVRRKFLDGREHLRMIAFLEKFALGNSVALKVVRNGAIVLDVSATNLLDRIAQVYTSDLVSHMKEVDYEEQGVVVKGYVSAPSFLRKDHSMQALFVNGRLVESEEISKGLYEAYKSILFVHKHPVAILQVEVKDVDVNVHPSKKIVKFSFPDKIKEVVHAAVKDVFADTMVVFEGQDTLGVSNTLTETVAPLFEENKRFQRETQVEFVKEDSFKTKMYEKLPDLRIIGNVAKTFFLAEVEDGLMLIDQHVVEERINYEKFMAEFMSEGVQVQELLQAELLEFHQKEAIEVQSSLEKLKEFGYSLEPFGDTTFRLRTVPILFNKVRGKDFLLDLLVDFKDGEKEKIVTRMACRNAIKAGDTVSISQLSSLLKLLDKCELPFTCPHGRPTMIRLKIEDMEKMFRRKGF